MRPGWFIAIALLGLPLIAIAAEPGAERQLMLQLLQRIEQLEQELRQLRGQQEVLEHRLERVEKQAENRYGDADRRSPAQGSAVYTAPESSATGGGATLPPPPPSVPPGAAIVESPPIDDPVGEKAAYERTFALLRAGKIDESITGFETFMRTYPSGDFADNAQYWLGEAHYVNRDFAAAKEAFSAVIERYPDSAKLPDAQLKLGFTQFELNQAEAARETLQGVVRDYPGTTAARLADQRLKGLR